MPVSFPLWAPLLRAQWEVNDNYRRVEGLEPLVAAVEAPGTLRRMTPDLQLAGVTMPPSAVGEGLQLVFEHWALDLLAAWSPVEDAHTP